MKLLHRGQGLGGFTSLHQLHSTSGGGKCSTSSTSDNNIETPTSVRHKSEISESNVDLTKTEGLSNSDTESDLIGAGCGWQLTNQRHFYKKKGGGKGGKGGKKRGRPKSKPKKPKKKGRKGKKKGKAKKKRHLKDIFAQYKL